MGKKFFVCVPLPIVSLFFFRCLKRLILAFIFESFYKALLFCAVL